MCEYCGCQNIDVIAELTAEHDLLRNLGADLAKAAEAQDLAAARSLAGAMLEILAPHTAVEEGGLFPAMAGDYAAQLGRLTQEHRAIDAALSAVAGDTPGADWPATTRGVLADLFDHILKEQDGVFPAALATLSPDDWEATAGVRRRVGSGLPARPVG